MDIILEDYKIFGGLTFEEKLGYWDKNEIHFENIFVILEDDITLDLAPSNLSELVQYNKWVVEHYRKNLSTEISYNQSATSIPGSRYLDFQSRKTFYAAAITKLDLLETESFIAKQKMVVDSFLKRYKVRKDAMLMVKNALSLGLEEELYTDYNSLKILKGIAQSIDIVKYWLFLRREELELRSTQVTQIPYHGKVTIELIDVLNDVLIKRRFIHPDTERSDLLKVFIKDDSKFAKIRWIDNIDVPNKDVRILSLVILIEGFFNDVKLQTKFICRHFVLNKLDMYGIERQKETKPPTNTQLKNARQTPRITKRVEEIEEISKDIWGYIDLHP